MPIEAFEWCRVHLDPALAVAHAVPHRVVPQLLRLLIAAPILPDSIREGAPPATASTFEFVGRLDVQKGEAMTAALQYAAKCPNLTAVDLCNISAHRRTCAVLALFSAAVPKLRDLSLTHCHAVDAEVAAAIAEIPNIRRLDFTWCVTPFVSESLALLTPDLQALNLSWCRGAADSFQSLAKLRNLEELDLTCFGEVNEAAAMCISQLPRLWKLHLSGCMIVDPPAVLRQLSHLPLRTLHLVHCKNINAAALSHLPRSLRTLHLQGCRDVDAAALKHIGELTQLVDLNLAECVEVDGVGLSHLVRLRRLSRLDLTKCPLVDSSALLELSSQVRICVLLVSGGERVDPAAVKQLRQRIPHVTRV